MSKGEAKRVLDVLDGLAAFSVSPKRRVWTAKLRREYEWAVWALLRAAAKTRRCAS